MIFSEWRLSFFRSLTVLLSAGIPLHTALEFIQEQQTVRDSTVLGEMIEMLVAGYRFSQALAAHNERFDAFHINSIRIAEETGSLVRTIAELETCEQRRVAHRNLLKQKLTYPAVLAVVCLVVVVILPVFCLDGLLQIIRLNTDSVPVLTQGLIKFHALLFQPIFWALVVGTIAWATFRRNSLLKSLREKRVFWKFLSLLGPLNQLRHLSSSLIFSNSLALQLEVGLAPLQALPLAAGTTGDPVWEELGLKARDRLVEGATFSEAFADEEFLDSIFLSIIAVGQESGSLPRLLKNYVKMCQEELEYRIGQLLALLEPLLLLMMGFVFAVLMLATLQPMLNLVRNL